MRPAVVVRRARGAGRSAYSIRHRLQCSSGCEIRRQTPFIPRCWIPVCKCWPRRCRTEGTNSGRKRTYLPSGVASLRFLAQPGARLFSYCVVRPGHSLGKEYLEADIRLLDEDGCVVCELLEFRVKLVAGETDREARENPADLLYDVAWVAKRLAAPTELRGDEAVLLVCPRGSRRRWRRRWPLISNHTGRIAQSWAGGIRQTAAPEIAAISFIFRALISATSPSAGGNRSKRKRAVGRDAAVRAVADSRRQWRKAPPVDRDSRGAGRRKRAGANFAGPDSAVGIGEID